MKRTRLNYLEQLSGCVIAEVSRGRNVPLVGDEVVLHSSAGIDSTPVKATWEVKHRVWVADGSEVDLHLERVSPYTPTQTDAEE